MRTFAAVYYTDNMRKAKNLLHTAAAILMLMGMTVPAWAIFDPVDYNLYPDNMTMVIELKDGSQSVDTCEVGAFIGGECRGATRALDGLYYLIIAGEGSGQQVEIRTCLNGEVVTIDSSIVYVSDNNIGTPWEPYAIDISDATGFRLKGDCNRDGVVDHADIAYIIGVTTGSGEVTPQTISNADVNGDGTANVADIITVIGLLPAHSARSGF